MPESILAQKYIARVAKGGEAELDKPRRGTNRLVSPPGALEGIL